MNKECANQWNEKLPLELNIVGRFIKNSYGDKYNAVKPHEPLSNATGTCRY